MAKHSADAVAGSLAMQPHPEGGAYVETWRDAPLDGSRGSGSAILFLLRAGEVSRWHRVDATEIWHFHAGAPVELVMVPELGEPAFRRVVGSDVGGGERPQVVVPAGAWQTARSLGDWSLVGCTVSPAFTFDGFELAGPEVAAALDAAQEAHDAARGARRDGADTASDSGQDGEGEVLADGDPAPPASSMR